MYIYASYPFAINLFLFLSLFSHPNPLEGTGYASEHDNYLCATPFGSQTYGDNYRLPCVAPRDDWKSQFKEKFVITVGHLVTYFLFG